MGSKHLSIHLGQFRFGVCVSTSSDSSQDHGQDSKVLRHAGHCDTILETIQVFASHSPTTQPMSSDTFAGRPTVPVLSSTLTSSVSPWHETVSPSCFDVTRQALRNHTFTEPVVEMASASIRDSSSHLYPLEAFHRLVGIQRHSNTVCFLSSLSGLSSTYVQPE